MQMNTFSEDSKNGWVADSEFGQMLVRKADGIQLLAQAPGEIKEKWENGEGVHQQWLMRVEHPHFVDGGDKALMVTGSNGCSIQLRSLNLDHSQHASILEDMFGGWGYVVDTGSGEGSLVAINEVPSDMQLEELSVNITELGYHLFVDDFREGLSPEKQEELLHTLYGKKL